MNLNDYAQEYWQAIVTRDKQADGLFVYAVRSTGIYCNPSCPARKPKREYVRFFERAEAAEQAGFRPCRRCHPEKMAPGAHETQELQLELVQQLCRYIETHCEEPLTLGELSEQVHLSPSHMQRVFKRIVGVTPLQYIHACRLKQLKGQIKDGASVTKALYEAGYSSSSRLYEQVTTRLGMTPGTYQKGGTGMTIHYTLVDCALGRLLVAATDKGVCAVYPGDDDAALSTLLLQEYPAAEITRDETTQMEQWVSALLRHLTGQQPHLELPLDVQATAFQRLVWDALRAIPYGETRSYSEIAAMLGSKKKARAVALACASNPVALAVPCHRVVRESGTLGGYRWGIARKQYLLDQEKLYMLPVPAGIGGYETHC